MGCIYIDGSGQVVFKQDAFLLNHGLFPKQMFQDDSRGCMNRYVLMQALQALCQSWGIYHKYFTDAYNKAFKKKSCGSVAFRVFFGSAPSTKKCKYSSWITNFKNLPIQLAQGAASEGGIDLGSKGSREVNRCRRWILYGHSHSLS